MDAWVGSAKLCETRTVGDREKRRLEYPLDSTRLLEWSVIVQTVV